MSNDDAYNFVEALESLIESIIHSQDDDRYCTDIIRDKKEIMKILESQS
tara:strand:+ start:6665 stop:6811 length:147 start_codon:yes stop_codon:yes gene_type:complete